jgi:hypothetical protein
MAAVVRLQYVNYCAYAYHNESQRIIARIYMSQYKSEEDDETFHD